MLGVGGGTAIKLLHETFPGAHITAIDIDSQMIDIAKFYFHLDNSGYVSFVQEDANKFVRQEAKKHKHYDMVIVDLFTGYVIPRFVTEISFLQALKEIISRPVGVCIFNYLRELQYAEKSNMLFGRLKRIFSYVSDFSIENNRFFFTSIV